MWHEIIGAKIKTDGRVIITNDIHMLVSSAKLDLLVEPIRRDVVQFLSNLDLGPKWDALAKGATLFYWDGGSEYLSVKQYNEMESKD